MKGDDEREKGGRGRGITNPTCFQTPTEQADNRSGWQPPRSEHLEKIRVSTERGCFKPHRRPGERGNGVGGEGKGTGEREKVSLDGYIGPGDGVVRGHA